VLLKFIENVGDKTIRFIADIYELLKLSFLCFIHLPNPYSYNPAMRKTVIKQIYFTAITLLPSFMLMAFIFGTAIMGMVIVLATNFNLQLQTGSIIVTIAINEFAPLFATFFIAFKAGAVLNAEVAVMNINNELKKFKEQDSDIIDNLLLPHIISGILSTVFLAALFALIMISSAYIFSLFYSNMNLHAYTSLILHAMEVRDIMILLLKSMVFGFVTMLIPIYSGLMQTNASVSISVLNGMVRLFVAILFLEILSLLIQLIL